MGTSVRAQRVMTPSAEYEPCIARYVWALEDARQRTMRCVEGLTDSAIDWIPARGGYSIGTLLYHVVAIEMSYLYEDILEAGWSEELDALLVHGFRDQQGRLSSAAGESLAEHLARLDAGRALLLDALRGMTLDDFRRSRALEEYDITPEWALYHLTQHEAEHREQIIQTRAEAERS